MINTQFIERLNRLPFDLIPLVILQFPKNYKNYALLLKLSKYGNLNSLSKRIQQILKSHLTYGPRIRNHFTIKTIVGYGDIFYTFDTLFHREYDEPAIIYQDGTKVWCRRGQRHRDGDQPALIRANGTKMWYQHGGVHRNGDQPAIVWADGAKEWYQYGQRHRDGDLPAITYADGTQEWWIRGKRIK